MTLTDLLHFILQRLDLNSDEALVVTADETLHWPAEGLDLLMKWGLLTPIKPRTHLLCEGCEEQCIMPVEVIPKSERRDERAFIACDKREEIDIVPVELEQLRQWKIDPAQIAILLGRLLEIAETPQMIIQNRLWRLGRVELAESRRDGFLGYSINWGGGDSDEILKTHLSSIGSFLLVPWRGPSENTHDQLTTIMTLREVLFIQKSELSFDFDHIEAALSNVSSKSLSKTTRKFETDISDVFRHSEDYSSVWLRGEKFVLTSVQRQVIQALHEAFKNDTPELSSDFILEKLNSPGKRLRDLFKGSGAWDKLIVPGDRRATYRLNL